MSAEDDFLEMCNGKCRCRVFGNAEWEWFKEELAAASIAAIKGQPYYAELDAGGVPNAYKYSTTTARCGVYANPGGKSLTVCVGRAYASKNGASCIFHGGEKSYLLFHKKMKGVSDE